MSEFLFYKSYGKGQSRKETQEEGGRRDGTSTGERARYTNDRHGMLQ